MQDSEYQQEEKKSFKLIYGLVILFYAIMITVFGIVVHNATEDGAQDVVPDCKDCPSSDGCPVKDVMSTIFSEL